MNDCYFVKVKSYREDGKFIEHESGNELTEEEAVEAIIDLWNDIGTDYGSWEAEKIIFKYNDD